MLKKLSWKQSAIFSWITEAEERARSMNELVMKKGAPFQRR